MKASFNVVNAVAAPAFKVYEFAQGHRSSQEKIVTAQSHPSVIHCPCKLLTKDETMTGSFEEKKGSVLKRSQCVCGLGGGGDINLPLSCAIKRASHRQQPNHC